MIELRSLRLLQLGAPLAPGRPCYLAAASGLVGVGELFYVVADDELHLAAFASHDHARPGDTFRLFEGELPLEHEERKARKPDLEALAFLPATEAFPSGALLALGSGSTKHRGRGAIVRLNGRGLPEGEPQTLDLQPLYRELESQVEQVNIEGAAVVGDVLWLFQRGNDARSLNAVVRLPLARILSPFAPVTGQVEVRPLDLGELAGVPLTFTDASPLGDGRVVFTAAAEDSQSAYADGQCMGSAVGLLSAEGALLALEPLHTDEKVEGVQATQVADGIQLMLVSDADDSAIPSRLFEAKWTR